MKLSATPTATLTVTPSAIRPAIVGSNVGSVPLGGYEVWTYEGLAGEVLTIRVSADKPASGAEQVEREHLGLLDIFVIVQDSAGRRIAVDDDIFMFTNTDALIENCVLHNNGSYAIIVQSYNFETAGSYTLVIESRLLGTPTATLVPTYTLTPSPTDNPTITPLPTLTPSGTALG